MATRRYQYCYARIDLSTGMCVEVIDTTLEHPSDEYPDYIPIPEYNGEYLMKYYINGSWYSDAAGTQPWSPA